MHAINFEIIKWMGPFMAPMKVKRPERKREEKIRHFTSKAACVYGVMEKAQIPCRLKTRWDRLRKRIIVSCVHCNMTHTKNKNKIELEKRSEQNKWANREGKKPRWNAAVLWVDEWMFFFFFFFRSLCHFSRIKE